MLTTCGLLIRTSGRTRAAGAKAIAMRWSSYVSMPLCSFFGQRSPFQNISESFACPMTKAALTSGVQTPIAFFHEDRIPLLTKKRLSDMDEEEFRRRAFSWRGREPLLRNLDIFEK